MKRTVVIRGVLTASLGLSHLFTACSKEDCERETVADEMNINMPVVPKQVPAIRCHVEVVCKESDGSTSRTHGDEFKIPDRFNDRLNKEDCAKWQNKYGPFEGCKQEVTYVQLCVDSGSGGPGPSGNVGVGVGVGAGPGPTGDYFEPMPTDEGVGGASGQSGAEPGQGET